MTSFLALSLRYALLTIGGLALASERDVPPEILEGMPEYLLFSFEPASSPGYRSFSARSVAMSRLLVRLTREPSLSACAPNGSLLYRDGCAMLGLICAPVGTLIVDYPWWEARRFRCLFKSLLPPGTVLLSSSMFARFVLLALCPKFGFDPFRMKLFGRTLAEPNGDGCLNESPDLVPALPWTPFV